MSLCRNILWGMYSFLDWTKEQLLLDLAEHFWIFSLGIVIMAFNYSVQVQMPTYLGVPSSTTWLAGSWLMGVWVMQSPSLVILHFFGMVGGEFNISEFTLCPPKARVRHV